MMVSVSTRGVLRWTPFVTLRSPLLRPSPGPSGISPPQVSHRHFVISPRTRHRRLQILQCLPPCIHRPALDPNTRLASGLPHLPSSIQRAHSTLASSLRRLMVASILPLGSSIKLKYCRAHECLPSHRRWSLYRRHPPHLFHLLSRPHQRLQLSLRLHLKVSYHLRRTYRSLIHLPRSLRFLRRLLPPTRPHPRPNPSPLLWVGEQPSRRRHHDRRPSCMRKSLRVGRWKHIP
jgi:hypothetical protein